jgi:bifunctional DNase/RNase
VRRYRILRATGDPNYVMIYLEFDSASEAEAVKAALSDPTSPPPLTHGLRVRILEEVETEEY